MDILGTHIIGLLNESRQVYLPGLGTFKKERVPASFDKKTNTFLAPTQRIAFSTEKGSSAPLINSISKTEEITDEEGENQLKKTIDSILSELNEKGQYTIQHLGKLIKQEDEISFIEDEKKESLPFYKDVNEIKLIEPTKEPLLVFEKKDDEETEERSLSAPEFEPKGQTINWLWPVMIIIVIAIAGGLWFLNSQKLENKENSVIFESSIEAVISDTNTVSGSETQEISDQDTSSTLSSESTESIKEETPVQFETRYEIIIVSFGKRSEAEKYVENMNAKGYKIRILENKNPGNLYKISYGSFIDETEAQLELNKVRETLSKEAWIYKNKT